MYVYVHTTAIHTYMYMAAVLFLCPLSCILGRLE